MSQKMPYIVPGLESVGLPGNRKPANIDVIEGIAKSYNNGKGAIIDQLGRLFAPDSPEGKLILQNDPYIERLKDIKINM